MGRVKRIKPEAEHESPTSNNSLPTTVTIAGGLRGLFNKAMIGGNNNGSGVKTSIPANFGAETIGSVGRVEVETNESLCMRLQGGGSALKNDQLERTKAWLLSCKEVGVKLHFSFVQCSK